MRRKKKIDDYIKKKVPMHKDQKSVKNITFNTIKSKSKMPVYKSPPGYEDEEDSKEEE